MNELLMEPQIKPICGPVYIAVARLVVNSVWNSVLASVRNPVGPIVRMDSMVEDHLENRLKF